MTQDSNLVFDGTLRTTPLLTRSRVVDPIAFRGAADPDRLRRKALFLDRDGVLNLDHGWVGSRDRFDWMPGALRTVAQAVTLGWYVFIVTNQSGIARGFYQEADLHDLMAWMIEQIRQNGGTVDDWRYCPHHPQAPLSEYRRQCDCRKPGAGMLLDLMGAWDIDANRALLIGDSATDMEAAGAAGISSALFQGGNLATFAAPLLSLDVQARNGNCNILFE